MPIAFCNGNYGSIFSGPTSSKQAYGGQITEASLTLAHIWKFWDGCDIPNLYPTARLLGYGLSASLGWDYMTLEGLGL